MYNQMHNQCYIYGLSILSQKQSIYACAGVYRQATWCRQTRGVGVGIHTCTL